MSSGPPEDIDFKLSRGLAILAYEMTMGSIDSYGSAGNIGTSASSNANTEEK